MTAEVQTQPSVGVGGPAVSDAEAIALAWQWCRQYLARPHPLIGRSGQVCPFVESATLAGTLMVQARATGAGEDSLDLLAAEMERTFRTAVWAHRNRTLHALVMVLPDLPEAHWERLDGLQSRAKPGLAERGLMLGQFHPACRDTAARNPDFLVSRAPVPMLALRRMAFHDILFLDSDPQLFSAYARLYGNRYSETSGIDPVFRSRYENACTKFEIPTP